MAITLNKSELLLSAAAGATLLLMLAQYLNDDHHLNAIPRGHAGYVPRGHQIMQFANHIPMFSQLKTAAWGAVSGVGAYVIGKFIRHDQTDAPRFRSNLSG